MPDLRVYPSEPTRRRAGVGSATSAGGAWLDALRRYPSASAMREELAARHPGFVSGRPPRLAVLGAGPEGRRLVGLCAALGIEIAALCDDNADLQGVEIGGHRVCSTSALDKIDVTTPVIIASHRVLDAMARVRAAGFNRVAPFALLQVLAPEQFPPHMFYKDWLDDLFENRAQYTRLRDALADDASRRVLDAVIGFRITLDPEILRPVIDPDLYAPAGLFPLGEDEVYVDAGAFDGDSIRMFIERTSNKFKRILAFEPDSATYARLAVEFADDARITTVNKGLFTENTSLRFEGAGTRGSALAEAGDVMVPVVALDDVLGGDSVSYIKMNIEGAELDALRGARRAIAEWAPRLAISAYHRPGDLWAVPELIRQLHPGYALYLRQHDGGVIETVAYALP